MPGIVGLTMTDPEGLLLAVFTTALLICFAFSLFGG